MVNPWRGLSHSPPPGSGPEGNGLGNIDVRVPLREVFRRFWPDVRPFCGRMAVGVVLVLVSLALGIADFWLFKVLIDDALGSRNPSTFLLFVVAHVTVTLGSGALSYTSQRLAVSNGEQFILRLRNRLFAHMQTLSSGLFDRHHLGDLLSRFTADTAAIEGVVLSGIVTAIASFLELCVFVAILFWLDWRLALVALTAVPLFWVLSRNLSPRIKAASRELRRRAAAIGTVAEESFGNALLVQAYGREQAELARFDAEARQSVAAATASVRVGALFGPLVDLLEILALLAIVGLGSSRLAAGSITLSGLSAFLLCLSRLYGPARGLRQLVNNVNGAKHAAQRIIELFEQRPVVLAPPFPVRPGRLRGHLRLHRVGFSYPHSNVRVLDDVTFEIPAGTTTAVVGVNGAGKTTLTKLLLRLLDPSDGSIRLDGHDLREFDPAELRAQVAVVLQETLLFDASVAENILAGRPSATQEELIAAARAADAHDFVIALPNGYDTRVGQRGRLLSGGQRQRIAIARAMIRDAPLLILDEPTASLDAAAAERVLPPLRRLMTGRTTIVISRNLSTVVDADQIVYLAAGRITETGTHRELMRRGGGYAELYRLHRAGRDFDGRMLSA